MDTHEAYKHCESIVRQQAANFYYGIRLLPGPKRRALSAVYAFARRVDDVGDGDLPRETKLELLDDARISLRRMPHSMGDPVLTALGHACGRYEIPEAALRDLIDGVEMDVRDTEYTTFEELVVYCRNVASSVGHACLAVFGPRDAERAARHGDALGVAMQLTNILRDVLEDLERGRVYLPLEDRERLDCVDVRSADGRLDELILFEARRAREWFSEGLKLLPLLDRRSAACVAAMAGIYVRILRRIERDPTQVMRGRISLPALQKALVAVRGLAGRAG